MTEFLIQDDEDFRPLKDKHVIVTGASSGIGLATVKLLLEHGAFVTAGDLNAIPLEHTNLSFTITDVTSWKSLTSLFKHAVQHRPIIDHVFANAGIGARADYLAENLDENGDLLEPTYATLDVNLRGMLNTSTLGVHYMRKLASESNSVVVTASASSFQRFRTVDYTTAKHGVLGFMRGMVPLMKAAGVPIRMNAIAPSWTATGLVPDFVLQKAGAALQYPEPVARSVALLMADSGRNGQLIYSSEGRFKEVEDAVLLKCVKEIIGEEEIQEDTLMKIRAVAIQMRKEAEEKAHEAA
ncbi:NAD(P)-binding protein [Rhizodiscina lignyota]|uniref:NAD(P)-binding protein n=1 Tax=Rhizodiscina lignyota TaxID=1504668 RepID=A0A9P4ILQ4_9PEZI|nr:NAD(P)-binding protein [Rhizodiscina lignyota]